MVSNCGHDENGGTAGKPGDQTGREWEIVNWYQYPVGNGWQYMIRHPNRTVGNLISDLACEGAANNNIGYSQPDRYSFWARCKEVGYRPANINTPCNGDCSSTCIALVKCAGNLLGMPELAGVSYDCYTGNIRQVLKAAGFQVYTGDEYLSTPDNLLPGDMLLREGWHICTNVTAGKNTDIGDEMVEEAYRTARIDKTFRKPVYRYVGVDRLPVRVAPSADSPLNPAWQYLGKNNGIIVYCKFNNNYALAEISAGAGTGTVGFVDARYLSTKKV